MHKSMPGAESIHRVTLLAFGLLLLGVAGTSLAGPNAGGTLVVHDVGLPYTDEQSGYPSPVPAGCALVDGSVPPDSLVVWKVYAAFPPTNQPRLKALAFGEEFDPALVHVVAGGLPSDLDFEIPQDGWPTTPGGGVGISFGQTQTGVMAEVYWFGGYGSTGGIFETCPHPFQASIFVDDQMPPLEDPIVGFGSIGFGVDGETPCAPELPQACCFEGGACVLLLEWACAVQDGIYLGGPCAPNPCPQPPFGACCDATGACVSLQEDDCGAVWQGAGSVCDPNPCPQPLGACCAPDGSCTYVPNLQCAGQWLGSAVDCSPNPCTQPLGACCYPDGHCTYVVQSLCPGEWLGMNTICLPNPCAQPSGACCHADGSCSDGLQADCPDGEWRMFVPCDPDPCSTHIVNAGGVLLVHDTGLAYTSDSTVYPSEPPISCELSDNSVPPNVHRVWKVYAAFPAINQPRLKGLAFGGYFNETAAIVLAGGLPSPLDVESPQPGWPTLSGSGVEISFWSVQTTHITEVYWFGGYGFQGGIWSTAPHPAQPAVFRDDSTPPVVAEIAAFGSIGFGVPGNAPCDTEQPGACCFLDGTCQVALAQECQDLGGSYFGGGCEPSPCPPPATDGACCYFEFCSVTLENPCVAAGGHWYANITCDPNPCGVGPEDGACCYADGTCHWSDSEACPLFGGDFYGGPCDPNPCPQPTGGGDTIEDAQVIAGLPFNDTGTTSTYTDDYDAVCPYTGSTSPDVVYRYVPPGNEVITVDLCASEYDTKVYVYEDIEGNLVACNDDAGCGYSGWQSRIDLVTLVGGRTYYIVVDGYGGSNGAYVLRIEQYAPCVVTCPAGGQLEGEPPCQDDYVDDYNGGCQTGDWMPVMADFGGCATLCGKSCAYAYQGYSYRDTDWFTVDALGGDVTYSGVAEFPLQLILIYGLNCANLEYVLATSTPCEEAALTWTATPGQELWLWVGASVFSGFPESDYVFDICGIQGGVIPVKELSWGQIKKTFYDDAKKAERERVAAGEAGTAGSAAPSATRAPGGTAPPVIARGSGAERRGWIWGARKPVKEVR